MTGAPVSVFRRTRRASIRSTIYDDHSSPDSVAERIAKLEAAQLHPHDFTGHIRAVLNDGRVMEERQPHLRGGAREPLTRADVEGKFMLNARHGGWTQDRIDAALQLAKGLFDGRIDLQRLRG